MKSLTTLILSLSCVLSAQAAWVKVDYEVKDEYGMPVSNVVVKTRTQRDYCVISWTQTIKKDSYISKTDKDGRASCRFRCHHGNFDAHISAPGYYPEVMLDLSFGANYDMKLDKVIFPRLEKKVAIRIRKIRNPIELKLTKGWYVKCPLEIGEYAFDLEAGAWVSPRGKGKVTDLVVCVEAVTNDSVKFMSGKIVFPRGGAYREKLIPSQHFKSVYNADTNAVYHSSFPFEVYHDEQHLEKNYCHMPLEKEDYWVFRVREVKDAKGNLRSANYGKIYGMIRVFDHFHYDTCYFNPTTNDTNLEEKMPWLQSYYTNSTDTVLGPK